ncbi:DUF1326 domain-containing protein [Microvirga yunnanensis]|uniref:DUF1326 domain-containing protein n=1 Tax=Microvirga yunnanensis TaxID=2953740 RepID=UPI0021CA02E7|nr:DUF1326 domain-containing protein [Microvirga sp. HBU65207]
MSTIPEWHLSGDWFDICSCDIPCPCEFAQAPTNNACQGLLAWHIRNGHFGPVRLDGLNLLALGAFEGNLWTGEAKATMGLFIDEKADQPQRDALQIIFSGQAGGWPASFAATIGELRGIELVPITFEVADDLGFWRAEIPGRVVGRAEALTGPTTPPGQRVQTINPPGSEVGPGQVATWGRSVEAQTEGFGFQWTGESRSSKHIPFDWSGPASA